MRLNPLTYGLTGLRRAMYWGHESSVGGFGNNVAVCLAVSVAFAGVLFALASAIAGKRTAGDLQ
jgi:hypothetical protein